MTVQRYSWQEALERIYRLFRGDSPSEAPESLTPPRYSHDESLSRFAELLAGSLPGETASLPSAVSVVAGSLPDASTTAEGVVELATNAEALAGADTTRPIVPSAHAYAHQNGIGAQKLGSGANYIQVSSSGTVSFVGTARTWEDLRVPVTSTKTGGTKDPGFALFKRNGSSQGVFTYWFDKATEEELYFVVQTPHNYLINSVLHPHVHWTPKTNITGTVAWGLEYTGANITGTFGNTTAITANVSVPNDVTLVAGKHYRTELPGITGSVLGFNDVSGMLVCRVYRDAAGSGSADSYDDDAGLLEVDFHYQIDGFGSYSESTKV